jgi:DNA-binding transcriptional MerR regulator
MTIGEVTELLGEGKSVIHSWHAAGLKTDAELEKREDDEPGWRKYTFRDLICLSVMKKLIEAGFTRAQAADVCNDAVRARNYFEVPNYVLVVRKNPEPGVVLDWEGTNARKDLPKVLGKGVSVAIAVHQLAKNLRRMVQAANGKKRAP